MAIKKNCLNRPARVILDADEKELKTTLVRGKRDTYIMTHKPLEEDSPELKKLLAVAPLIAGVITENEIVKVRAPTREVTWERGIETEEEVPPQTTEGTPEPEAEKNEEGG